jgi:acyl carrier protein
MNEVQIRNAVLNALQEAAPGAATEGLDPIVPFRDQFEFDSIDFVNFVFALERIFALQVNELDCPHLSSLQGSIDFLKTRVG